MRPSTLMAMNRPEEKFHLFDEAEL
jgi:hypothetical protein